MMAPAPTGRGRGAFGARLARSISLKIQASRFVEIPDTAVALARNSWWWPFITVVNCVRWWKQERPNPTASRFPLITTNILVFIDIPIGRFRSLGGV